MKQNVKVAKELVKLAKELTESRIASANLDPYTLRRFFSSMFNMDGDLFQQMYESMGQTGKSYTQEKFQLMQRNFMGYILSLDDDVLKNVINFALTKNPYIR